MPYQKTIRETSITVEAAPPPKPWWEKIIEWWDSLPTWQKILIVSSIPLSIGVVILRKEMKK